MTHPDRFNKTPSRSPFYYCDNVACGYTSNIMENKYPECPFCHKITIKLGSQNKIKEIGKKDDASKTDMTNLKFKVIEAYAKVLNYGEEKYGRDNYKLLDNYERRFLAANMRHLLKRIEGEIYDKESGLPHLAHCMANSGFVMEKDLE